MNWELIRGHYSRPEVRREIYEYCRGRWVAIHCEVVDDRGLPIMIRYEGKSRRPLRITSEDDVIKIIDRYAEFKPRAFYATAHIYSNINYPEDVFTRENILASSPTWDIDLKDGSWKDVIQKASEIIDLLEREGVINSVFVKWSGRGAHVHINPHAFSEDIRKKIDPLDIAYSITQYIVNRLRPSLSVAVENKIDIQRVFTAPLSFHRTVNRVAVCIPPDLVNEFDISWTDSRDFKHFPDSWRKFVLGEGDELAEKAFFAIGPYIAGRSRRRKHKPLDQEILEAFRRFGEEL